MGCGCVDIYVIWVIVFRFFGDSCFIGVIDIVKWVGVIGDIVIVMEGRGIWVMSIVKVFGVFGFRY